MVDWVPVLTENGLESLSPPATSPMASSLMSDSIMDELKASSQSLAMLLEKWRTSSLTKAWGSRGLTIFNIGRYVSAGPLRFEGLPG